jgi:hypothetical protein
VAILADRRDDADEQVARVRDRRVSEHSLDRFLPAGDQVGHGHRENGKTRDDRRPARAPRRRVRIAEGDEQNA